MIVKKLRDKNSWSQEQLAAFSGLSLRTIQRIEAGNTASLETLKSIASVFQIEIKKLTEEVIVIDKDSKEWKKVPLWVSLSLFGIKTRKTVLILEIVSFVIGIIGYVVGTFFYLPLIMLSGMWVGAYSLAVTIRWVDNADLW